MKLARLKQSASLTFIVSAALNASLGTHAAYAQEVPPFDPAFEVEICEKVKNLLPGDYISGDCRITKWEDLIYEVDFNVDSGDTSYDITNLSCVPLLPIEPFPGEMFPRRGGPKMCTRVWENRINDYNHVGKVTCEIRDYEWYCSATSRSTNNIEAEVYSCTYSDDRNYTVDPCMLTPKMFDRTYTETYRFTSQDLENLVFEVQAHTRINYGI